MSPVASTVANTICLDFDTLEAMLNYHCLIHYVSNHLPKKILYLKPQPLLNALCLKSFPFDFNVLEASTIAKYIMSQLVSLRI